jgi:chemotaxis receptor (MCP) glutamine deamidase CheD
MQPNTAARLMLGVGDYGATKEQGGVIRTMTLGSCVAVMILDQGTRCVGMDHVALPESTVSPDRANQLPHPPSAATDSCDGNPFFINGILRNNLLHNRH